MNTYIWTPKAARTCVTALGLLLITVTGLSLTVPSAFADDPTGPTVTGDVCLQQLFGTPVSNSNKLNCTANDISLSQVVSVNPTSCTKGTTFDLEATFEINVTANSRYDAGFVFRIDGGANARGDGSSADGKCSLSGLSVPPVAGSPALNLDGDSCGDLNSGVYEVTFLIPEVDCQDPDNDGKLNLPYCTSWHSKHGTACTISNPFSLDNAPDFKPDTKSKCVCDDNFEVPVSVEEAELEVTKTASPTEIAEPGGAVTYTVQIKNTAVVESVVIDSIDDDIYGDLTDGSNPDVTENDCPDLVDAPRSTLSPGETETCSFKALVSGNFGDVVTDVVTACAEQADFSTLTCDDDDADVTIIDSSSEPSVAKSALAIDSCQMDVDYQVVVSNNSEFDALTLNALTDDLFGDVTAVQGSVISTTCSVPQTINTNGNYTCSFTGRIRITAPNGDDCEDVSHTNTVTADSVDEDGVDFDTDSNTVTVTLEAGI